MSYFDDMFDETREENFVKSLSAEAYHSRGFIKEGELVQSATELLGLDDSADFKQVDEMNISIFPNEDIYIVGYAAGDEELTREEIENQVLEFVKQECRWGKVTVLAFREFREDEISPIHENKCVEFKGKYEFVKAKNGWVTLSVTPVHHFIKK